jgi:hypothetical protein
VEGTGLSSAWPDACHLYVRAIGLPTAGAHGQPRTPSAQRAEQHKPEGRSLALLRAHPTPSSGACSCPGYLPPSGAAPMRSNSWRFRWPGHSRKLRSALIHLPWPPRGRGRDAALDRARVRAPRAGTGHPGAWCPAGWASRSSTRSRPGTPPGLGQDGQRPAQPRADRGRARGLPRARPAPHTPDDCRDGLRACRNNGNHRAPARRNPASTPGRAIARQVNPGSAAHRQRPQPPNEEMTTSPHHRAGNQILKLTRRLRRNDILAVRDEDAGLVSHQRPTAGPMSFIELRLRLSLGRNSPACVPCLPTGRCARWPSAPTAGATG